MKEYQNNFKEEKGSHQNTPTTREITESEETTEFREYHTHKYR